MRRRWLASALGIVLAGTSIVAALDAVHHLHAASVLADSGANLPREVVRNAEFNGVYFIGFVVGSVTTLVAVLSFFLLRIAVRAWRRGPEAA
jgi:hypothetical protein